MLIEAQKSVERFTRWYNDSHRHNDIIYVMSSKRHRGDDIALLIFCEQNNVVTLKVYILYIEK